MGNQLQAHGFTPTGVDYLGDALSADHEVIRYSNKKSLILRLLHMLWGMWVHRKTTQLVLIDLYSTRAFWFGWAGAHLANLLHLPFILVARGGDLPKRLKNQPKFAKQLWQQAALVVAPSAYLAENLAQLHLKCTVIPNHIPIVNYKFQKRLSANPKLLYARAIHRKYNPQLLIAVVALLKQSGIDATLIFVGNAKDNSVEDCLQLAAQKNVSENITFKGKMSKADWHALAADCGIFVNPTTVDNTPISVIEACALGLPVVSTAVGGVPYLLQDGITALLVPSNDPDRFAEAIKNLLENPDLVAQLSTNGRMLAESFDWSNVRPTWNKIIEKYALQPAR